MNEEEKKIYSLWFEMVWLVEQRDEEIKEDQNVLEQDKIEYNTQTNRIENIAAHLYNFLLTSVKYRIPNCPDNIYFVKGFRIVKMFDFAFSEN